MGFAQEAGFGVSMRGELPNSIRLFLRQTARSCRRRALLRRAGWAFAVWLALISAAAMLDRWLALPADVRLILLITATLVWLLMIARPLWSWLDPRIDLLRQAELVESLHPELQQRLTTVVSELMAPGATRGSRQMLERLAELVQSDLASLQKSPLLPMRTAAIPWLFAAIPIIVITALAIAFPSLQAKRLAWRILDPLSAQPPVTRTILSVEPGDVKLVRGESLTVRAHVDRLAGNVEILTAAPGESWSRVSMQAAGDQFLYTVPAIDRDVRYFVRAGDATSAVYTAAVRRPPILVEMRAELQFPAHTRRSPVQGTISDGQVEAVAGTRLKLSVSASEALSGAKLTIEGHDTEMEIGGAPNMRQCEMIIRRDAVAALELTSSEGVQTRLTTALRVRCLSDQPPLARLLQPADDLRLHRRDLVPICYQAIDDYGLARISAAVQVNSGPEMQLPLTIQGDSRRQEARTAIDLATLGLQVGDVVAVSMLATDGNGQRVRSERRSVLVSPRSVDLNTYQRIADLRQSAQMAGLIAQALDGASDTLTRLRQGGQQRLPSVTADRLKFGRDLAGAGESALVLHQFLLRASSRQWTSQQMLALADAVDRARVLMFFCQGLVRLDADDAPAQALADRVQAALDHARKLTASLKALSDAELAAAVLADMANLKATSQSRNEESADLLKQIIQRTREELGSAVESLNLKPGASDLERQLQKKVEQGNAQVRSARAIDWVRIAAQFAAAGGRGDDATAALPERLYSAGIVQAVRSECDAIAARDLQLASAAAGQLRESSGDAALRERATAALAEFPEVLAAVLTEHGSELSTAGGDQRSHKPGLTATEARSRLAEWCALTGGAALGSDEAVALQASADVRRRNYDAAEELDRRLLDMANNASPGAAERLTRSLQTVRRIDAVSDRQGSLRERTAAIRSATQATQVANEQMQLADQIDEVDTPSLADRTVRIDLLRSTAQAIQQVQQQLAQMPQQMTLGQRSAEQYSAALAQAASDSRRAASAEGDAQAAAQRVAEQSAAAAEEMARQLQQRVECFSESAVRQMRLGLAEFQPDTSQAIDAIERVLAPAMAEYRQAMLDPAAAHGPVASELRSAIDRAQASLRQVQSILVQRDPLLSARWYSEAASSALLQQPADVPRAAASQQEVSSALSRAWEQAVRYNIRQRLTLTHALGPIVSDEPGRTPDGSAVELLPGLRPWGSMHFESRQPLLAPLLEIESSEYREPLRLYFQALSKTQDQESRP